MREAAGSENRRTVPGEIHILSLLCFVVTSGVGGQVKGRSGGAHPGDAGEVGSDFQADRD